MTTDLNKRIAIGAGWMISLRWVDRFIQLASIVILARLLLPVEFGLVAYAMVFLGILDQFFAFNFETFLIRDRDTSKESYSTAWTLNVLKGFILSSIIVVSAKPVAAFFGEPKVEGILYWIAAIPILKGLVNIGTVDFQKDLTFHKEFFFNIPARLAGSFATIVFALVLRSYWALVYGSIIQPIIRVILSYVMSDFRPRLSLAKSSRVLGFSKWLLALNINQSISSRLPMIVIGRCFDAQALAFFNMAKEISSLASEQFAAPIKRALYPGIIKMQQDRSRMTDTLTITLGIIILVGLPAVIGIGVTAPLLVLVLLGKNWIDIAPIVKVLSLAMAAKLFLPGSHLIYYALNRPKISTYISSLHLCILVPTVLLVVPEYGALGAAWALAAVYWFMLIIDYLVLFRVTTLTLSPVMSAVWRSTLAVIIMAICVTFTIENPLIPGIQESTILHLGSCIVIGVFSYETVVLVLWWLSGFPDGPEARVIRILKKILNRTVFVGSKNKN